MYLVSRYLENNSDGDDALAVLEKGDVVWFCVSDGAGGSGYGAKASDFIVRSFVDFVQKGDLGEAHLFEAFLRDVDQTLFAQKHGGEATAIIGKIDNGTVMGASVGDSKAILYHSNYDFELTSMQCRKPLLGSGESMPIGFGPVAFDGCLLVGSDGLFNYVDYQELNKLMNNKIKTAEDVAVKVSRYGKQLQDDLSIILIEKI